MMPAYRCMESCPQQKAQMPTYQYHYPMNAALPPQAMMMDPAGFPVSYGGHPSPVPYHTCCGPNCFTNFSTPYAYVPAPFHGSHPVCPAVFPYQYDVPLHYPVGGFRFGTDSNTGKKNHCCGCPNHTHSPEGDRKFRIEEAEPEDGEKEGGPLPMIERIPPDYLKNKGCAYPVLWIPPDYLKNVEHPDNNTKTLMERQPQKDARASGDHGSVGSDFWKQFFPFDMSKMESLKQGANDPTQNREGKESTCQIKEWSDDGRNSQLPIPIMFLPPYGSSDGTGRSNEFVEPAPKSVENKPSERKVHPDDLTSLNNITGDFKMDNVADGKKNMENLEKANIKSIPVKQITHGDHKSDVDTKVTGELSDKDKIKKIPVKDVADNQSMKSSETAAKMQPASAKKTSKLPPICLRVDPLPRKRNVDGLRQSPGSPSSKKDSQESAESVTGAQKKQIPVRTESNCDKVLELKKSQGITESTMKENGEQEQETLAQKPVDSPTKLMEDASVAEGPADLKERKDGNVDYESSEGTSKANESRVLMGTESENDNGLNILIKEKCKHLFQPTRSKLSEGEAATMIQAAFRGFEVRRSDPLKKLKQIAEIRKQIADVENRMQTIGISPGIPSSDNQHMVIGETIMSLLLKLDTIQGLHPTIRDIRKSVARELTNLHGKLDSLTNASTEEQKESQSVQLGGCVSANPCTCDNTEENQHRKAGNESCLEGAVKSSSPAGPHSTEKALNPSDCQHDGMVPSSGIDTNSSRTGEATVLDGNVADQDVEAEAPIVPRAGREAEKETETNECSPSVNSAPGEGGEENIELVGADSLVAMDDKIEDSRSLVSPVDVTTEGIEGHVSEFELRVPVEKLKDQSEPALMCEPEKADKCEAGLESQHEFAEATHCKGAEADKGVDFVSVEVEEEAPNDAWNGSYETSLDGDRVTSDRDPEQEQEQSEGVQEGPLVPESDNPSGDGKSGIKQIVATEELEAAASWEKNVSAMTEASDDMQDLLSTVPPSNEECTGGDEGDVNDTELSEGQVGLRNESELQPRKQNEELVDQGNVQASPLLENYTEDSQVGTEIIQELDGIIGEDGFGFGHHVASQYGGQMLLKDIVECSDLKSPTTPELSGRFSEQEPREVDVLDETPVPPAAVNTQDGDGEKNSADSGTRSQLQESDKRLIEENEKLRNAMEKLIEAGREQMLELSRLNGRVKDLEKKLNKRKLRTRRCARMYPKTSAEKLPVASDHCTK